MKQCSQNKIAHNLNIHMYSFKEVLELFQLSYHLTEEDMKRAKMQVLRLHPDKSRLPSDYFLFYKKAYEMVYNYYMSNNKQNQKVPEKTQYDPTSVNVHNQNKSTNNKITSIINNMSSTDFQNKFNELYEKNMVRTHTNRNDWFSKEEEPAYKVDETVSSKNIGEVFDKIKQQQMGMVRYNGVQDVILNHGAKLYDNADDEESNDYISCDLFNKLKFDDIRKVHKDQTIFSVSENEYANVAKYKSVDHYNTERSKQNLTPLEKQQAEMYLSQKDKLYKERMAHLEHQSQLRSMEYAEKNKAVLSTFLHLTNG